MLVILYTIEEGENGVGVHMAVVSKPEQETEAEKTIGRVFSHVLKNCEIELAKHCGKTGTMVEGKDLDKISGNLMHKEGLVDIHGALKRAGFGSRTD